MNIPNVEFIGKLLTLLGLSLLSVIVYSTFQNTDAKKIKDLEKHIESISSELESEQFKTNDLYKRATDFEVKSKKKL